MVILSTTATFLIKVVFSIASHFLKVEAFSLFDDRGEAFDDRGSFLSHELFKIGWTFFDHDFEADSHFFISWSRVHFYFSIAIFYFLSAHFSRSDTLSKDLDFADLYFFKILVYFFSIPGGAFSRLWFSWSRHFFIFAQHNFLIEPFHFYLLRPFL